MNAKRGYVPEDEKMDKEMMNRIYEAMKADSMSELNLEDLEKVSGGDLSYELRNLNQACTEYDSFSKEMCKKYGMSTVPKAIMTNQLSPEEKAKWIELNKNQERQWQAAKEYLLSLK